MAELKRKLLLQKVMFIILYILHANKCALRILIHICQISTPVSIRPLVLKCLLYCEHDE